MREEMSVFLSAMALGEYVAFTDCKMFVEHFKSEGNSDLARKYEEIAQEEKKHFSLIRKHLKTRPSVPDSLKGVFRGQHLVNQNCILEKIALVHIVFEPAAFSYFSSLIRPAVVESLGDESKELVKVFKLILKEEVGHMKVGYEYLADAFSASYSRAADIFRSVRQHRDALIAAPKDIFIEHRDFAYDLAKSFEEKVNVLLKNFERNLTHEV